MYFCRYRRYCMLLSKQHYNESFGITNVPTISGIHAGGLARIVSEW